MTHAMTKYSLLVANVLVMLCGIGMVATGVYALTLSSNVTSYLTYGFPTGILLLGLILCGIAAFGVNASFQENESQMHAYFGMLIAFILIQVVVSVIVLAKRQDMEMNFYDEWTNAFRHDKDRIEKIEKSFHCCGFATVKDKAYPDDCNDNEEFGFSTSCREALVPRVKERMYEIGSVGLILAGVESIALLIAIWMFAHYMNPQVRAERLGEARQLLREGQTASYSAHP